MRKEYYLGLDIGTNSVGYAVTDTQYQLLKHAGEPMWGSHVFEEGKTAAERRAHRTARRNSNRKKQRVNLVSEIFAPEIAKVDERFFIRRKESALLRDYVNIDDKNIIFNDSDYTDADYYREYPTIHHLICALMQENKSFDIRLVFMACAYLVSHRGHFLSDVCKDNILELLDFSSLYDDFKFAIGEYVSLSWDDKLDSISEIVRKKNTISGKEKKFLELLNNGKKFKTDDDAEVSMEGIIKLLSGGKIELSKVFPQIILEDSLSISFTMEEEEFYNALMVVDDKGPILSSLRRIFDWGILADVLQDNSYISEAKVKVYEQHKADLRFLKSFIRKYLPNKYYEVFRDPLSDCNYVAYSYNFNGKVNTKVKKKAKKEDWLSYLKKLLANIVVDEIDRKNYEDMMSRIELLTFLPKQVQGDNRVIPYQLYYVELKKILENMKRYYPFLAEPDNDGFTPEQKILSIMEFRIPYYVGPLRTDNGTHGWMVRKAEGKIYPWNFGDKVDLDESEKGFIRKMTNKCSYIPGEDVLPKNSLLYNKYTVLNEINNIRINGAELPILHKQKIYQLFEQSRKVTLTSIKNYLKSNNLLPENAQLSGLDIKINSSLKSYHDFKRLLQNGLLNEKQVEEIIEFLTYSEDKNRTRNWLQAKFPHLEEEDIKYLSKLKYNDFGRLSRCLLSEIRGCNKETGEELTVIGALWETNANLMQILSNQFTFSEILEEKQKIYYQNHPNTLDSMLEELYVNNAVRRSIYRTIDVLTDVKKACGSYPKRIFVEMARGGGEKNKRTKSRREQILELYKNFDKNEIRELSLQLEGKSDNELQSEVLFLYFMQLGRSAYSDTIIDINKLKTNIYNVDHIYPQSYVKDDSLTNKVLVLSTENGGKGDQYPLSTEIRTNQKTYWSMLLKNKLISEEKYKRLTRNTPFTEDEKQGFINRQLVATAQATKAVAAVLKWMCPDAEIVYSKASLVSEFRKEYDMLKCRTVNDLHHAKDAYLNIVVGNVYHCRFTKKFYLEQKYSLKTKTIFGHLVKDMEDVVWTGEKSIEQVRRVIRKNNIHYTKFAFYRKGGLFDQMPVKKGGNLIPLKKGLDTNLYGGYNKPSATGFLLVQYLEKGKKEAMFMPVELIDLGLVQNDEETAIAYAKKNIESIWKRKDGEITDIRFPLGRKILRVNTVLSFDGFRACVSGKNSGGRQLLYSSLMDLRLNYSWEKYIKACDSYIKKNNLNSSIVLNELYDGISREKNVELYNILVDKIKTTIFSVQFGACLESLNIEAFNDLDIEKQIKVLCNIILLLKTGRAGTVDFSLLGGSKSGGAMVISSKLSNWKNKYKSVKLVYESASGIYHNETIDLLDLLDGE